MRRPLERGILRSGGLRVVRRVGVGRECLRLFLAAIQFANRICAAGHRNCPEDMPEEQRGRKEKCTASVK